MTKNEIYDNLCWRDRRHPDNDSAGNEEVRAKDCHCDNCFYGRDRLAIKLLKSLSLLEQVSNIDEYGSLTKDLHNKIDDFLDGWDK